MKNLLTLTLLLIATAAFAIGNYTTNDELYVYAPSGLKLRSTPDGETVLATIPFGAKLKVLEQRKVLPQIKTVDGLNGYWAKISYEGKTGYIFDGYLSFLPTPKEGCTSLSKYCGDFFKPASTQLVQSLSTDEEVSDENTIQLYTFGSRKVVLTINSGYEWGGEYITIQNLSLEEGYLLSKILFKFAFENSLKSYTEHPEAKEYKKIDMEALSVFKLTNPPNNSFVVEFYSECSNALEIAQRQNTLFIKLSSGC